MTYAAALFGLLIAYFMMFPKWMGEHLAVITDAFERRRDELRAKREERP